MTQFQSQFFFIELNSVKAAVCQIFFFISTFILRTVGPNNERPSKLCLLSNPLEEMTIIFLDTLNHLDCRQL